MKIQIFLVLLWHSIRFLPYGTWPCCLAKPNSSSVKSQRKPNSSVKNKKVKVTKVEEEGTKPCNFFVLDAIGACRYRLYQRLIRDNVYEGMGGKKVSV